MKSRISVLAVALLAVFLWGPSAFADLTFTGAPQPYLDAAGNDPWSQAFNESGAGFFDSMAAFITTAGVTFDTPGMSLFSDGSWSSSNINSQYALANGSSTNNLNFNLNFTSDIGTPFAFDFYAFNGNTMIESDKASWNGSDWSITGIAPATYSQENTAVPEPTSLLLMGSGLLGLASFGRRKFLKF